VAPPRQGVAPPQSSLLPVSDARRTQEEAKRREEDRKREEARRREQERIAEERRREEERKVEEKKEEARKLAEMKRIEEEKRKLEEEKKQREEEKKKLEEKKRNEELRKEEEQKKEKQKMDKIIENMEGIVGKNKKHKKFDFEQEEEFSASEIEKLVRQIVLQTLDQGRKGSDEPTKKERKQNLNALDAILENIFLENYTDSLNLEDNEDEPAKIAEKERSQSKTTSDNVVKSEELVLINEDLVDEIVDELLPIVEVISTSAESTAEDSEMVKDTKETKAAKEAPEEKKENFNAVQKALTVLIGENPSEEEKLPQEVFAAIIELDKFLMEEQEKRKKKQNQVESLLTSALDLVDTAVSRREEAERRLLRIQGRERKGGGRLAEALSGLGLSPEELDRILLRTSR